MMDAEEFFKERYEMLILYLNQGDEKKSIDINTLDKFSEELMDAINSYLKLGDAKSKETEKKKVYNRVKEIARKYAQTKPQYQKDYKKVEKKADVSWFDKNMTSFEKMNKVSPSNVDVFASHILMDVKDNYRVFYTVEEKEKMRQENIERVAKIYSFDPTGILKAFNNGVQGHVLLKMGADPDFVKFWFGEPYTDEDIAKMDKIERENASDIARTVLPHKDEISNELRGIVPARQDATVVSPRKKLLNR
jgi:flagellar hook-associated protein FlgK